MNLISIIYDINLLNKVLDRQFYIFNDKKKKGYQNVFDSVNWLSNAIRISRKI